MSRYRGIRYFAYVLEILVLFMVQETPGLLPAVFRERPVLLLPAALSIAFFETDLSAMAFGVLCGLFLDFGMGMAFGFHGLFLGVLCFLLGKLATGTGGFAISPMCWKFWCCSWCRKPRACCPPSFGNGPCSCCRRPFPSPFLKPT